MLIYQSVIHNHIIFHMTKQYFYQAVILSNHLSYDTVMLIYQSVIHNHINFHMTKQYFYQAVILSNHLSYDTVMLIYQSVIHNHIIFHMTKQYFSTKQSYSILFTKVYYFITTATFYYKC